MRVCFGVIVRVRITYCCVCVTSVVFVRFAPSDPAFALWLWRSVPHPALGFPTGSYPVGCEGRIHHVIAHRHRGGTVVPRNRMCLGGDCVHVVPRKAPPEDERSRQGLNREDVELHCSGSWHHHFGSSSRRSDLLISKVRRRNCPGNRTTAKPSPYGRRGSRQSPGGNRRPKHSWFHQTAVGTPSPLSMNPSPTRAPAAKVATPNAPNR